MLALGREAVALAAAVGFVGQYHLQQAHSYGRREVGLAKVWGVFQAQGISQFAAGLLTLRSHCQQFGNFSGDLVGRRLRLFRQRVYGRPN